MVSLVTLILAITSLAACAMARPAKTLADGPEGTIYFESLTLTDREFIRGVTSGRPVVISGDLRLPRGATGWHRDMPRTFESRHEYTSNKPRRRQAGGSCPSQLPAVLAFWPPSTVAAVR